MPSSILQVNILSIGIFVTNVSVPEVRPSKADFIYRNSWPSTTGLLYQCRTIGNHTTNGDLSGILIMIMGGGIDPVSVQKPELQFQTLMQLGV